MLSANERVRTAMTRLGLFSDEYDIAAFLEAEQVHGLKSHPAECVLANFIRRETGVPCQVGRTNTRVQGTIIDNPPVVCNFLKLFDDGCFPLLETAVFLRTDSKIAATLPRTQLLTARESMILDLPPWLTGMGKENKDTASLPQAADSRSESTLTL